MNNECWQDLGNAIVMQAVKDYRKAVAILKRYPKHKGALEVKAEVEEFFHSDWYSTICKVDSGYLLKRLHLEG